MLTIWKYELKTTGRQVVEMPADPQILSVAVQNGIPCLWAMVDSERPRQGRVIRIHGTGQRLAVIHEFIGTFMLHDGALVFHVFDCGVAS